MTLKLYTPTADKLKLNVLVYAEPGVGKTTLAATAQDHPAMKNVLFLNVEGGLLSVLGQRGIQAVDVNSIQTVEEVFWEMRNNGIQGKGEFADIKTVVLDSGSELQTLLLEQLVRQGVEKARRQGKERSPDDIYLEDYGRSSAGIARVVRWFRDLPVHFILTALPVPIFPPGSTNNPNATPIAMMPAFTGKLGRKIFGYMDMAWYMYLNDNGERCLLTRDSGIYRAKTRGRRFSDRIGRVVKNPNLTDLYNILLETETDDAQPNRPEAGNRPTRSTTNSSRPSGKTRPGTRPGAASARSAS